MGLMGSEIEGVPPSPFVLDVTKGCYLHGFQSYRGKWHVINGNKVHFGALWGKGFAEELFTRYGIFFNFSKYFASGR